MTGTPPGWYRDDPDHPRTLRWYDGARWTQHTRADTDPDVPPGPPPHPPAWTPAYGAPGSYPPPGPPPESSSSRPPLPGVGQQPGDGDRQTLVALGVISALLLTAIVIVAALLATYDEDDAAAAPVPHLPAAPAGADDRTDPPA